MEYRYIKDSSNGIFTLLNIRDAKEIVEGKNTDYKDAYKFYSCRYDIDNGNISEKIFIQPFTLFVVNKKSLYEYLNNEESRNMFLSDLYRSNKYIFNNKKLKNNDIIKFLNTNHFDSKSSHIYDYNNIEK